MRLTELLADESVMTNLSQLEANHFEVLKAKRLPKRRPKVLVQNCRYKTEQVHFTTVDVKTFGELKGKQNR